MKETHVNLRDGDGIIVTNTSYIKPFTFVKFTFYKGSTLGAHSHRRSKELMITFSPSIRFNNSKRWKLFDYCKPGKEHSVQNISKNSFAHVFAIKF